MFSGLRLLLTGIPVIGPVLGFLTTPIGMAIVGVVAFFVWLGAHDARLVTDTRALCRADELRRTIAELQRQNDALEDAARRSAEEDVKDDRELDRLRAEAAKPSTSTGECKFSPDDLRRLRNIK
jgi:hypothetical protein